MSEYLSKEEIKQWRSSLEKITLEEYAKRLGKVLKEEKQTRDIVDIVMQNEKKSASVSKIDNESGKDKVLKLAKKAVEIQQKVVEEKENDKDVFAKLNITFKKALTQREKTVLEYFVKNKDNIVYAKDLAAVLELPTDYVYKYIKNLRAKISENILENAVKGGYKLSI